MWKFTVPDLAHHLMTLSWCRCWIRNFCGTRNGTLGVQLSLSPVNPVLMAQGTNREFWNIHRGDATETPETMVGLAVSKLAQGTFLQKPARDFQL